MPTAACPVTSLVTSASVNRTYGVGGGSCRRGSTFLPRAMVASSAPWPWVRRRLDAVGPGAVGAGAGLTADAASGVLRRGDHMDAQVDQER